MFAEVSGSYALLGTYSLGSQNIWREICEAVATNGAAYGAPTATLYIIVILLRVPPLFPRSMLTLLFESYI